MGLTFSPHGGPIYSLLQKKPVMIMRPMLCWNSLVYLRVSEGYFELGVSIPPQDTHVQITELNTLNACGFLGILLNIGCDSV